MEKVTILKGKLNTIVTVAMFLGLIISFTIISLMTKDKNFSFSENRVLAQKPKFSVNAFFEGTFSTDYEEYITDQFFGRDNWIQIKTRTELALGKKDINGVYIGKDDYFIEMQDSIDEKKAYANADKMMDFVEEQIESLGAEHVSIMVVPTAVNVLKDKLPSFASTFNQDAYLDYMKERLGASFVDVRESFLKHKDDYIYYKTDHHWTTYGAFLAYEQWAKKCGYEGYEQSDFEVSQVSKDFLGTVYSKNNYATSMDYIEVYNVKEEITYEVDINMGQKQMDSLYAMEYLEEKDKYSVFLGGNNSIVDIDVTGGRMDGETLLVIKDSYAHSFVPFVANHYDRVVVIDLRYLKMPISDIMEQYGITDILVLYNVIHFAEDNNFSILKK